MRMIGSLTKRDVCRPAQTSILCRPPRITGPPLNIFSGNFSQNSQTSSLLSPFVAMVRDGQRETLAPLKAVPGKDIWLFGGGLLVPFLLGADVPVAAEPTEADQTIARSSQSPTNRQGVSGVRNQTLSG